MLVLRNILRPLTASSYSSMSVMMGLRGSVSQGMANPHTRGHMVVRDPSTNKGCGFDSKEREKMGLSGLNLLFIFSSVVVVDIVAVCSIGLVQLTLLLMCRCDVDCGMILEAPLVVRSICVVFVQYCGTRASISLSSCNRGYEL